MEPRPPKGAVVETRPLSARTDKSADVLATVGAEEVDIVEHVLVHRDAYLKGLEELREYYRNHGYANKETWAEFELAGLRRVKAFRYILDSEVPVTALRPTDAIPEADTLYQEGLDLMRKGGHGIPALYSEKTMIQAADAFRELVEKYPSSDKIDDAAFFLGEIHKEYLKDQEPIAVKWYERSWTWDPQTPHPARFQAAVVYDYRLHDRDRALELYQAVLKDETFNGSNVRFSSRRVNQLVKERPEDATQVVIRVPETP